jgi:hypothetical protein
VLGLRLPVRKDYAHVLFERPSHAHATLKALDGVVWPRVSAPGRLCTMQALLVCPRHHVRWLLRRRRAWCCSCRLLLHTHMYI